jgi:hypothetical protein
MVNQISGIIVMYEYFALPILMIRRADAERHRREQLIRDSEQRPERVDAAERDRAPLIEEVPHIATISALESTTAGYHDTRPKGSQTCVRDPAA